MSLIKAWWNGATSSDNKKDLAPVKKPGILAALVTVAALAMLLIPSANQGLRAVLTSWRPNREVAQQAQFMQIAREAESRGDAKTLAFVAMRVESRKDFVSLANQAVALDPSLTWIFSQGYFSNSYVPGARDWPAKLEAYDPGNSVAFLVQAQIRTSEISNNSFIAMDALKNDPQWLEDGRKALESPRYDSYRNRRMALDRDVIQAVGIRDAGVIGLGSLRASWISLSPAGIYSKKLLGEANLALQRGDKLTAKHDAWIVAHFGEIVRAHGGTEFERRWAVDFLRPAYKMLQPMLAAEGRNDESAMLSEALEATKPGAPGTMLTQWPESTYTWIKTASVAMSLGAALALILGAMLLMSGFWLLAENMVVELRTGILHRFACHTARDAPSGLIASLAVLAGSYGPTTNAVDMYLSQPISNWTLLNLNDTYYSVYWLPDQIRYTSHAPFYPAFWLFVMAVGVITILMIVGRNIMNRTMRQKAA